MVRLLVLPAAALCLSSLACAGSRKVGDEARPVATPSWTTGAPTVAAGRPFSFTVRFDVAPDAPPFARNYTVFVHLIDRNGHMIGASDHEPPMPTRQWKPGSTVEYTHSDFAPTTGYSGPATVVVGLYSPSTGERLPLAGDRFERRAIKVGSVDIRQPDDPYPVTFRDGWHPVERTTSSGLEWRWSMKSGALTFPNPKRDVELVLQLDEPAPVFATPQHVEVRMAGSVVDDFDLESGRTELRRIALSQAQLGGRETGELAVVSDKTFIPAELAQLRSPDTRQLGVRVFRAYIEPKQ